MRINNSERNGKALEYKVSVMLTSAPKFNLTPTAVLLNQRDHSKYRDLPPSLREKFKAASVKISEWVHSLFSRASNVSVDRLNDNADDPSDIRVSDGKNVVSISLKHNHSALKHPRPYSFAQFCGFPLGSMEDFEHRSSMSEVASRFRAQLNGISVFNQCDRGVIDSLYGDVNAACKISLDSWQIDNIEVGERLFHFLVGSGFYKVIVDTRNNVNITVQDYQTILVPNEVTAGLRNHNRLILCFGNDWRLNLRIHNASSEISAEPSQLSLKYDAQRELGDINEFQL